MKLVTPVSELFRDLDSGRQLAELSFGLEARPDLGLDASGLGAPITHAHFSKPELDAQLYWDVREQEEILRSLHALPDSLDVISFHLSRDFVECQVDSKGRYTAGRNRLSRKDMHSNVARNLEWLRSHFAGEILLENNNFYATGCYDTVTSPDMIRELVSSHADGLLLDLAHAVVSAWNRRETILGYLGPLLECDVKQLHVSLPRMSSPFEMRDAHDLPDLETLVDLDNLFGRSRLREIPVTIEYYQDSSKLAHFLRSINSF